MSQDRAGRAVARAIALATISLFVQRVALACDGDFDLDGRVTVDEILTIVDAALDSCSLDTCLGDFDNSGRVDASEIIRAVGNALLGCELALGATCARDDACVSGHCVHDVCCQDASCAGTSRCDILGDEGRCTAPLGLDSNCFTNSDCAPPLFCAGPSGARTCMHPRIYRGRRR